MDIDPYTTKAGLRYRVRFRKDGRQTDKRGFRTIQDAIWYASALDAARYQEKLETLRNV